MKYTGCVSRGNEDGMRIKKKIKGAVMEGRGIYASHLALRTPTDARLCRYVSLGKVKKSKLIPFRPSQNVYI